MKSRKGPCWAAPSGSLWRPAGTGPPESRGWAGRAWVRTAARARKCPWGQGGGRLLFPGSARAGAGQLLGGERSSLFPQSGAVTHGAHTFHSRRPRQAWLRVKAAPGAAAAEQVPTLAPAAPPSRPPHAAGRARRQDTGRAACLTLGRLDTTAHSLFQSQCVAHLGAESVWNE